LKLYRRLFRYTRPYRAVFALAILGMLLVASTYVIMLQLLRPMINDMGAVDAERGRWL
jgi:ABC-type multidrug transport system fused ATPase/permease subunit